MKRDGVIVDMTTSSPQLAVKLSKQCSSKKVFILDAPVSGGDIGAKNATLSIMVGGDSMTFDYVLPIFKIIGKNIQLMGNTGLGQHTKLMNQIIISSTMVAMAEGLIYAHKAGLDLEKALKVVCKGAAGSWSLSNYGPRILNGDFEPGFTVKHFLKDMRIALDEAERMNLNLPGLEIAYELYQSLVEERDVLEEDVIDDEEDEEPETPAAKTETKELIPLTVLGPKEVKELEPLNLENKGTQTIIHALENLNDIQIPLPLQNKVNPKDFQ